MTKLESLERELASMQLAINSTQGAIVFALQLKPQAKQRPRLGTRTFTPDETRKAELAIKRAAKGAMQGAAPLVGPLRVDIQFVVPMVSYAMADDVVAVAWNLLKRAWAFVGGKGNADVDNLAKLVLDACNGLCFDDDVQVVDLRLHKTHDAGYLEGATAVCIRSCADVSPPRFGFFPSASA